MDIASGNPGEGEGATTSGGQASVPLDIWRVNDATRTLGRLRRDRETFPNGDQRVPEMVDGQDPVDHRPGVSAGS